MPRILYVEDEPFLGKIVRETFEGRGFEVLLVADGQAVPAAFEQFRPDVCVLDVMLPHRDGFSLGEEIRRRDAAMPILFLTAKSQTADVLKGFASGGNDYVRKPFSLEELLARIENLLALSGARCQPKSAEPDCLTIGQYRFFPLRQSLELPGQPPRQLSHRETQLLETLASRPNAVVARQDILKQVWGHDSIFNSRNLDVYITRLRDYLKEDAGVQLLTLRGVGYRLVMP